MGGMALIMVAAGWMPAMTSVSTDLEQHPRPDWARPYANLNGPWRFDFDPEDAGLRDNWAAGRAYTREIRVPYPWQSALSGVHDPEYQGVAWYERDVTLPTDLPFPRIFAVFGAVDWHATVWVNGQRAVEHEGGYTPFEVELTKYAQPGETVRLTVRAHDVTDPEVPSGKQTGWYTPTGGIWQTVYLEGRGDSFLRQAHVTPDIDRGEARIDCIIEAAQGGEYTLAAAARPTVDGATELRTSQQVTLNPGENRVQLTLAVPEPRLWTPDSPTLYFTDLSLARDGAPVDAVRTYFGMRKVSRGTWGDSEFEYILLNDKPVYLRGALHQSFNPEGIYTHPDDDFIRRDYELAKELGFNFIRIHIKVDEPRALYWADRLGVLLMCDMPNFARKTDRSKKLWEETLRAAVARDFNHPSIFAWCDFNETWGIRDGGYDEETQRWVVDMYRLTKELDPTRLVEDNSPCYYDHTETDINSWHFYIDDYEAARKHIDEVVEKTFPGSDFNYIGEYRQGTAPLINSEYGGVSAGGGDRDVGWCFLHLTNQLRRHGKIGGYVYTELSDIEWEHNGFLNYDRSEKEFPYPAGITLRDLQGEEFPVIDGPPYRKVRAGETVEVPLLASHWSERDGLTLRIFADGRTVDGRPWSGMMVPQERPLQAKPYTTTPQEPFRFTVPEGRGILNLVVEIRDGDERLGANYCVFDIEGGPAWADEREWAASFPVHAFSAYEFGDEFALLPPPDGPAKVFGYGAGAVEYTLRLPADLAAEAVEGGRLLFECGAKADRELVDWPQRVNPQDYPQTDVRKWPTDVRVYLEGELIQEARIATDYGDVAGVLSHAAYYHHGSHGELIDAKLDGRALDAFKKALSEGRPVRLRFEVPTDGAYAGGLALYGRDMGFWPADPTLVLNLAAGAKKPASGMEPLDAVRDRMVSLLRRGPDGAEWRYVTTDPGDGWQQPDFDDGAWKTGRGGFGREGTPGARISTQWHESEIWLRTLVSLPAEVEGKPLWFDLHHDEDAEVYVNGKRLLARRGYVSDYERIVLTPEQRALFQPGADNLIAIHCRQTSGGQYIDAGMVTFE